VMSAQVLQGPEAAELRERLEWPPELAIIKAQVRIAGDGGIKPTELAQVLLDAPLPPRTRFARLSLLGPAGMDLCSPAALQQKGSPAANRPRPPAAPVVAEAVPSAPL